MKGILTFLLCLVSTTAFAQLQTKVYNPGQRRTIVALHGSMQKTSARIGALSFSNETNLINFGRRNGWTVVFPEAPGRRWAGGRRLRKIRSFAAEINNIGRRYPSPCLAGFSDGATMAQYVAALHPGTFTHFVFHSGLLPKKIDFQRVSNQRIFLIVGTNDRFGRLGIYNWFNTANQTYSRRNTVTALRVNGLGHHWWTGGNSTLFR